MAKSKFASISGQFIAHRVEMLESAAWAALNLPARKCLDRLEVEHAHHGGKENGNLPVTYDDFVRFGIRRKSIPAAIRLLVKVGLIEVTHKGRGGNAEYRQPSRYRITHLRTKTAEPTDDWRHYELRKVVSASTSDKCPITRDIDSRGENATNSVGAKTPPKKRFAGGESAPGLRGGNAPGILFLVED